ncbi:ABC transporter ATP-binding protein [Mesorhizobium sp. 1B3]|uniref:ABC transporter ATP-binding protein n=1 Tax=Mesorhizobium sp. 1B3 TaxID=3243599 RepID=UPI003D998D5D
MSEQARDRSDEPLLDVKNLSVRLPVGNRSLHAVSNVSFSVRPGETLCLVGESGCGKTMTSLALMGLMPRRAKVTADHVMFEGHDLARLDRKRRQAMSGDRIAMIFQDPMTSLNPVLTVGDQLDEIYIRHRGATRKEARERALEMLDKVGVKPARDRARQYPHQLSGGLRQRVMIAIMLMCEPSVLIADEPTTALDVTVQIQILRLLRDLQRDFGTALLLITHDLGVVARMADRVGVMYGGRIVEAGPVDEIFNRPQHPYTRGLLDCIIRPGHTQRLASIPGVVPSLLGDPGGCLFRNRCPDASPSCSGEIPSRQLNCSHEYLCTLEPAEPDRMEILE